MRSCDNCGAELAPNRRRFCSKECSIRYNNQVARYRKAVGASTQELRERRGPCAHCSGTIPMSRRLGVRYCSTKCYNAATYNRAKYREYNRRKLYGITQAQFDALLESQGDVCALCEEPFSSLTGRDGPHLDHDHATGKVRGILCQPCNHGLGKFKDNAAALRRAADYIELHKGAQS